jgi:hypothetical protein
MPQAEPFVSNIFSLVAVVSSIPAHYKFISDYQLIRKVMGIAIKIFILILFRANLFQPLSIKELS